MFDFRNYSPSLYFRNYSYEIAKALDTVEQKSINKAFELLESAYLHINPVLSFGNGGSAAIANHFVADYVKCVNHDCGVYSHALSLVSNSPLLTCMANDYGYPY